jgi:hypothetical protein
MKRDCYFHFAKNSFFCLIAELLYQHTFYITTQFSLVDVDNILIFSVADWGKCCIFVLFN